eukprot:SAG31_NODE_2684_length_5256_cov_2.975761_5_plen_83_part_00
MATILLACERRGMPGSRRGTTFAPRARPRGRRRTPRSIAAAPRACIRSCRARTYRTMQYGHGQYLVLDLRSHEATSCHQLQC